jgi:hypothetical protein
MIYLKIETIKKITFKSYLNNNEKLENNRSKFKLKNKKNNNN